MHPRVLRPRGHLAHCARTDGAGQGRNSEQLQPRGLQCCVQATQTVAQVGASSLCCQMRNHTSALQQREKQESFGRCQAVEITRSREGMAWSCALCDLLGKCYWMWGSQGSMCKSKP